MHTAVFFVYFIEYYLIFSFELTKIFKCFLPIIRNIYLFPKILFLCQDLSAYQLPRNYIIHY